MKRVAIAAGGTGGHFYPGLVAAREFRRRGWEPLVIVRVGDPALATLEKEGLPALPVDLRGLPRTLGPELFSFAAKLAGSLRTLSRATRAFRPDLVVGMGGYLTFPLVAAARLRGIPAALHESNAILGLANAASRRLGAELFWGLPPADGSAARVVGTPVRPELWTRADAAASRRALGLAPDRTTVLVFGGSQGAAGINAAAPRALKGLGVQVLHLAGKGKAEATAAAHRDAGVDAVVREYCEDMAAAYGAADLVVCRSGASTLAELAAQRAPAVLVPYPRAAANHQDLNARAFEAAGAAVRLPEAELDARLGGVLRDLLQSDEAVTRRDALRAGLSSLPLPAPETAAAALATALESLAAR